MSSSNDQKSLRYAFSSTADQYAVMGHPISHSLSPKIHRAFADQTGETLDYSAIDVPETQFLEAVKAFRDAGGKGLNVTVPFKEEAWALCDIRTDAAELAGAVNTLWFEGTQVHGANTDGVGMLRDIQHNHAYLIAEKRVLILGAGGAVRGVLHPLLAADPAFVVIANRTPSKAQDLAAHFAQMGTVEGGGFNDLEGQCFDLVINGTSASLHGAMPQLPDEILADGVMCYDMMYASEPTPFMQWALLHRAKKVVDGFGMLVEQAAEAFLLWRGVRPLTKTVITELKP